MLHRPFKLLRPFGLFHALLPLAAQLEVAVQKVSVEHCYLLFVWRLCVATPLSQSVAYGIPFAVTFLVLLVVLVARAVDSQR